MTEPASRQFLEVVVAGEPYLIEVDAVLAVERVTRLTRTVDGPPWFDGVMQTHRGRILLVGMAVLLGHPPTPPLARARVLVLELHKTLIGLRTDSGSRTVQVPVRAITTPTAAHHVAPWVTGIVQFAEQLVMVISPRGLLAPLDPDLIRSLLATPAAGA